MKFQFLNSEWQLVESIPNLRNVSAYRNADVYIVDINDLKYTFKTLKNEWFPEHGNTTLKISTGILWTAFITYIFPIMLDIARVYCAFQIAQAFFKERRGGEKDGGKTPFQTFVHYGKWYILFWLIPIGVEFFDQIGEKIYNDIMTKGIGSGTLGH